MAGAFRSRPGDESRRIPWSALTAAAVLIVIGLGVCRLVLAGSAPLYPTGDFAVLEMYTRFAAEGPWPFGPYSRFGWHHPGPLFFYWEVPWYLASGEHPLGMHAGALVLSVMTLVSLLTVVGRGTSPAVGGAAALGFAVYLLRLDGLSVDVWNPLVVVLPMALLIALGAALAAGRWGLLPGLVLVASLVAQTHVSVVPAAAAVVTLTLLLAWRGRRDAGGAPLRRRALLAAGLCGAAVWALPVAAMVQGTPGNLAELATFFLEPAPPVPWLRAAVPWSALLAAPFGPGLALPTGGESAISESTAALVVAALHVGGLVAVAWAARARQVMLTNLAVLGAAVVLVAWWSLTRVRGPIGDYLTFWLSAVAVLNWSVILGGGWSLWRHSGAAAAARPRLAVTIALAISAVIAVGGVRTIALARATAADHPDRLVPAAADAVMAHLRSSGHVRPRINVAGAAWPQAAGVILELRKRGVPVTVEGDVAFVFASPIDGTEDALLGLADPATFTRLSSTLVELARVGDLVVVAPKP